MHFSKTDKSHIKIGPKSSSPPSFYRYFDTFRKVRIKNTIELAKHKGFFHLKREIFEFFKVKYTQGYEIIQSNTRRRQQKVGKPDRQVQKFLFSKNINRIYKIL